MSESRIEEWDRLEVSEGVALVTMDCRPVNALDRESLLATAPEGLELAASNVPRTAQRSRR